ncbi:hypothetical protein LA080_013989 [Diaporthe eres]|nr:hypothetical protein LA080_013989 [Diaporthe eres]
MCLRALTSFLSEAFVYFDLTYTRAIKLTENDLIIVVEADFTASDLLANANTEVKSNKMLQRNGSNSSVRSDCSERLHEYLRLQESLSSFPTFQETSSLFWRKQPTKGKHRSLQGKTVLIPPKRPTQPKGQHQR